jgi:hypothetical protein
MQWRPLLPKGGGLIHMDVGGLPPIPTGSFWQFSSLVVLFPSFQFPDLQGHFEALNNIFRDQHSRKCPLLDQTKMCSPWIDLSNGLSCA